jgi:hypothetical protein
MGNNIDEVYDLIHRIWIEKPKYKCKNCETTNPNQPTCKEMKTYKKHGKCSLCVNCLSRIIKDTTNYERKRILKIIDTYIDMDMSYYTLKDLKDLKSEIEAIENETKPNIRIIKTFRKRRTY